MADKPLIGDAAPQVSIASRAQWRAWLVKNHDVAHAVWLVTYKRHTGKPRLDYADLVDEALCFGWIDSTVRTLDGERSMNYVARRRRGSIWSRPNRQRVALLVAEGRMTPAGQRVVDAAVADGSWSALDPVDNLVVPPDLDRALRAQAGARAGFDALPTTVKKQLLWHVYGAKREQTRTRRVADVVRQVSEQGGRP